MDTKWKIVLLVSLGLHIASFLMLFGVIGMIGEAQEELAQAAENAVATFETAAQIKADGEAKVVGLLERQVEALEEQNEILDEEWYIGMEANLTFYDILANALEDPDVRECLRSRWSGFTVDDMYSVPNGLSNAKHGEMGKALGYLLDCSLTVRQSN